MNSGQISAIRKIINNSDAVWVFDYDLTLYGMDERVVLDSLDRYITSFLKDKLQVNETEADRLRQEWCTKFGTTLEGLRRLHQVEPHDYFDFIHSGAELVLPRFNARKQKLIQSIPGRKVIFTNGRRDWVLKGLRAMRLTELFDEIYDIEFSRWQGKPRLDGYIQVEQKLSVSPGNIIFIEDKHANLTPALERGWNTIGVGAETRGGILRNHADSVNSVFSLRLVDLFGIEEWIDSCSL